MIRIPSVKVNTHFDRGDLLLSSDGGKLKQSGLTGIMMVSENVIVTMIVLERR